MRMGGLLVKLTVVFALLGGMAYFGNRMMNGPLGSLLDMACSGGRPQSVQAQPTAVAPACGAGGIEIIPAAPVTGTAAGQTVAKLDQIKGGMTRSQVENILGMPTIVSQVASGQRVATQIAWQLGDDIINVKFIEGKVAMVVANRLRGLPTWRLASTGGENSQQPAAAGTSGRAYSPPAGAANGSGVDMNAFMSAVQTQLNGKDPNQVLSQLLGKSGVSSSGGSSQVDAAALLSQLTGGGGGQIDAGALMSQLTGAAGGANGQLDLNSLVAGITGGKDTAELMKMLESTGVAGK